jgi:hypothetical protein
LGLTGLSAVVAAAVLLLPDFRRLPFSACRSGLHTQENTLHSSVADPDLSDPMFLGLLDPNPDLLVRGTDPDPDPSIIKQKIRKILIPTVLLAS